MWGWQPALLGWRVAGGATKAAASAPGWVASRFPGTLGAENPGPDRFCGLWLPHPLPSHGVGLQKQGLKLCSLQGGVGAGNGAEAAKPHGGSTRGFR